MNNKIFIILSVFYLFVAPGHAASISVGGVSINKKVKNLKELRQENVVTQSLDYSCGAAGLSTLLNYYLNDPTPEIVIIDALLKTIPLQKVQARQGFSLFDLKKFAESRGYQVTGYKMDFEFLKSIGKPLLVPIKFKNYRHFVVVKGVVGDRVFIADPAVGNMTMKDEKFKAIWTNGIGFVVEHPEGSRNEDYALRIENEDVRMANYQSLKRLTSPAWVRTAIFTNEW